jgi:mannose-1-phosphate guanylyltransferase
MLHAVILAGGSGTRLWPESRVDRPKQFLRITGGQTMIQSTVARLGDAVALDRIWVLSTEALAEAIRAQLPQLPAGAVLVEPCPRNTAPCIGLAALRIVRADAEGVMAVLPADQVIDPPEPFQAALRVGASLVADQPRRLVTFGIRPTYPAAGFGYVERGEPLAPSQVGVYRVARFHEKPSVEAAGQYLAAGRFYWNSGIFLWKARTILDELAAHRPAMFARLQTIADAFDTPAYRQVLASEFAACEKVSIDYAVMENAREVVVVETTFAWDDVGGWMALARHRPQDPQGNVGDVERLLSIAARENIVRSEGPQQLVVLSGVEHLVVVVTPDAILVADKRNESALAAVTQQLRERGWTEFL